MKMQEMLELGQEDIHNTTIKPTVELFSLMVVN